MTVDTVQKMSINAVVAFVSELLKISFFDLRCFRIFLSAATATNTFNDYKNNNDDSNSDVCTNVRTPFFSLSLSLSPYGTIYVCALDGFCRAYFSASSPAYFDWIYSRTIILCRIDWRCDEFRLQLYILVARSFQKSGLSYFHHVIANDAQLYIELSIIETPKCIQIFVPIFWEKNLTF
jgi:hypothetical protein